MTGAMLAIIAFRCLTPVAMRQAVRAKLTPLATEPGIASDVHV